MQLSSKLLRRQPGLMRTPAAYQSLLAAHAVTAAIAAVVAIAAASIAVARLAATAAAATGEAGWWYRVCVHAALQGSCCNQIFTLIGLCKRQLHHNTTTQAAQASNRQEILSFCFAAGP
jgi:hypothetical protein